MSFTPYSRLPSQPYKNSSHQPLPPSKSDLKLSLSSDSLSSTTSTSVHLFEPRSLPNIFSIYSVNEFDEFLDNVIVALQNKTGRAQGFYILENLLRGMQATYNDTIDIQFENNRLYSPKNINISELSTYDQNFIKKYGKLFSKLNSIYWAMKFKLDDPLRKFVDTVNQERLPEQDFQKSTHVWQLFYQQTISEGRIKFPN